MCCHYTMHMHEEFLSYLEQFIAFKSVASQSDQKKQCLQWIEENFFHDVMLPVHRGEHQGAPYLFLAHPSPALLWFAHFDVVPANETQYALRVDGDTAWGRGVKDMKGATLTLLLAYREFVRATRKFPPVSILLTSDEEIGGTTIPMLFDKGLFANIPVGYTPDSGSAPDIITEHKGVVWAELQAQGRSGHGASPWQSKNPIPLLADALQKLHVEFPAGTADDWQMTITPTQLHASDAPNQVADVASCTLDIRFPKSVCATTKEALNRVAAVLPTGCRLQVVRLADPLFMEAQHPMVQRVKHISEEVLGHTVDIGREHGTTDARYFDAYGVPAFIYGPRGGGLHSAEEWVSIESLLQHVEINRRLLTSL